MRAGAAAALLCVAMLASAQEDENPHDAQPERPTVATHAFTVAPGWTEIESGLELDYAGSTRVLTTPTTLKLGLAKRWQIEATAYYVAQSDDGTTSGFGDMLVALKWRPADSVPLVGAFAIQTTIRFPTGSAELSNGQMTGELLLISSNHFGQFDVDVNFGVFTRLNDNPTAPSTATLWTVSAGTTLVGSLGWTWEVFGYPGTHGSSGSLPTAALLTGPTYQVHPWFVADMGLIVPMDGPQPHAFYVGLVWNIGQVWKASGVSAPSR
jgi:hypothetical protein